MGRGIAWMDKMIDLKEKNDEKLLFDREKPR